MAIKQWGSFLSVEDNSYASNTITFPVPFNNANYIIIVNSYYRWPSTNNGVNYIDDSNKTNTQVIVQTCGYGYLYFSTGF